MLSGISRRRKTDAGRLHFCEVPGGVRVTQTGSKGWRPGTGVGDGELASMGTESQFGKMRKFWR